MKQILPALPCVVFSSWVWYWHHAHLCVHCVTQQCTSYTSSVRLGHFFLKSKYLIKKVQVELLGCTKWSCSKTSQQTSFSPSNLFTRIGWSSRKWSILGKPKAKKQVVVECGLKRLFVTSHRLPLLLYFSFSLRHMNCFLMHYLVTTLFGLSKKAKRLDRRSTPFLRNSLKRKKRDCRLLLF